MARATRLYLVLLLVALALAAAAASLAAGPSDFGSARALVRFAVFILAIGAAAATWGTAVMIASVHRVTWPLVVATTTLVTGVAATAALWTSLR